MASPKAVLILVDAMGFCDIGATAAKSEPRTSIALNPVSQTNATLPAVVAKFARDHEIRHGLMAAASILATIPALVLMVLGQCFIVQGLTMGCVK